MPEVIFEDLNAISAAWLSQQMAIDASFSISRVLAQAQMAYTCAWNTVVYIPNGNMYIWFVVMGALIQLVEYRTRNQEVACSTHTRSTASNLEQVANLLCAQANSASYPQRDGKWIVATATGWRPSVADWGDGVSASCTMGPIVC